MSRAGFSLIEALAALIIASMVLAGALELQRQLADGQARDQRSLRLARLERDAMALTADLNPTEQPDGAATLGGGAFFRWRAEPLGSPALNTGSRSAGRAFELRLYRLSISLADASGPLGQFAYDRVGWRKLVAPAPYVPPPPAPPPRPAPAGAAPTEPNL